MISANSKIQKHGVEFKPCNIATFCNPLMYYTNARLKVSLTFVANAVILHQKQSKY